MKTHRMTIFLAAAALSVVLVAGCSSHQDTSSAENSPQAQQQAQQAGQQAAQRAAQQAAAMRAMAQNHPNGQ